MVESMVVMETATISPTLIRLSFLRLITGWEPPFPAITLPACVSMSIMASSRGFSGCILSLLFMSSHFHAHRSGIVITFNPTVAKVVMPHTMRL